MVTHEPRSELQNLTFAYNSSVKLERLMLVYIFTLCLGDIVTFSSVMHYPEVRLNCALIMYSNHLGVLNGNV